MDSAASPESAPRIRVAVLGLGLAGRFFHVPHFAASADFEVTVLCSRGARSLAEPLAAELRVLCPRARLETDALAAVRAADVDLVVIATPDSTHAALASAALAASKHVLVDKPMVPTLAQAAALLAEAAAARRVCMPYQNRRHCGDFVTVESLLRARRLGALIEYEAHFSRFRPVVRPVWKEVDRGALDNLGPHLIDQALLLFGPPARVWADVRALRDGAASDDAFELHLFYAKGAAGGLVPPPRWRAVLRSTMLAAANAETYTLHGTEGSFQKAGLDGQEAALCAGGPVLPTTAPGYGEEPAKWHGRLTLASSATEVIPTLRASFAALYDGLAKTIRSGDFLSAEIPPQMSLLLLRVLETARKSAASGAIEALIDEP